MHPKVSIIVPVYNVEKYLSRCIDSILRQTFNNFECILVDDCSPDNSPNICDEYSKKDNRIIVIHKQNNEGLPYARKTGFEMVSGDYIQFVDSDDWIEPDMTEKLYNAAINNNADIVVCDIYSNTENSYEYCFRSIDTDDNFNNLGYVHWPSLCNKLFKREIFNSVTFPRAPIHEDRVITQQCFFYSNKTVKIPYPLYHYFKNPQSMTNNVTIEKSLGYKENILFVINFLQDKLKDKYLLKEKEINEYVNNFKFNIIKNKTLRRKKELYIFYPQSKFNRWLFKYYIKKLIKFFLPYGLVVLFNKKEL